MTTIQELIPRTIYTIRVQAYTAIGPGPVSLPIQAKTEQGVPGQPRDFRWTSVTPTAVTLEWKAPFHIGDNVVGYELYWNDTFSKVEFQYNLIIFPWIPTLRILKLMRGFGSGVSGTKPSKYSRDRLNNLNWLVSQYNVFYVVVGQVEERGRSHHPTHSSSYSTIQ